MVTLSFFPLPYSVDLPLFLLVLLSIAFGALVISFFSGLSWFRHRVERVSNRQKIQALENEVGGLLVERNTIPPGQMPGQTDVR